jgi:hypothetical protein
VSVIKVSYRLYMNTTHKVFSSVHILDCKCHKRTAH